MGMTYLSGDTAPESDAGLHLNCAPVPKVSDVRDVMKGMRRVDDLPPAWSSTSLGHSLLSGSSEADL